MARRESCLRALPQTTMRQRALVERKYARPCGRQMVRAAGGRVRWHGAVRKGEARRCEVVPAIGRFLRRASPLPTPIGQSLMGTPGRWRGTRVAHYNPMNVIPDSPYGQPSLVALVAHCPAARGGRMEVGHCGRVWARTHNDRTWTRNTGGHGDPPLRGRGRCLCHWHRSSSLPNELSFTHPSGPTVFRFLSMSL